VETTQLQVLEVDPRDEQAFAAWFAVYDAAQKHDRPDEPAWLLHEQRSMSLDGVGPDPDTACVLLGAHDGDRLVGAARLELPQRDNLHLCEFELASDPTPAGAASPARWRRASSGSRASTGAPPC
jgi:hypothetical protein